MTPVFGSLLFSGAFVTLVIAILNLTDGSYLISSVTRPPRLKHLADTYAENGTPSDPKAEESAYRQSAAQGHGHGHSLQGDHKFGSQKSWSFDKKSNFFRVLKPAARHFMLKRHYGPAVSKDKRNQYDDFYDDEDPFARPDLQDIEENVIEENPKLSKNLNYYPYRGKRPFEVPQIGECLSLYLLIFHACSLTCESACTSDTV